MIRGYAIIKIKKTAFRKQSLPTVVQVIEQTKEDLILKIPYQTLNILDFEYEWVRYGGPIQYFLYLKKNIAMLFGMTLFVALIYLNSVTIKRIEFNAYTKDNKQIEVIIKERIKTVFGFQFLDTNLNDLNFELRKDFSHFEWIDVSKAGTVLKVTVLEPSIINKKTEVILGAGDLIADSKGFITAYQVQNGIIMITRRQYVEKGQLLVSGNLRVLREGSEPFYIQATGAVYADVQHVKTVEVLKKQVSLEYTGKVTVNKWLSLFGFDLKYSNNTVPYQAYDEVTTKKPLKVFGFELPFGLKKSHYYEKNAIITLYDEQDAYEYALSTAVYEVSKQFEAGDQIIEKVLLSRGNEADRFIYQFLIITNENIAEFKRSHVDE